MIAVTLHCVLQPDSCVDWQAVTESQQVQLNQPRGAEHRPEIQ